MRGVRAIGVGGLLLALVSGACGGTGELVDGGKSDGRGSDARHDANDGAGPDVASDVVDAAPPADTADVAEAPGGTDAGDGPAVGDHPGDVAPAVEAGDAPLDRAEATEGPLADARDTRDDVTGGDLAGSEAPSPDGDAAEAPPYDGSGALLWVQRSKGNGADQSFGMTVTTEGALVVGGHFNGHDVFAPDSAMPKPFDSKGLDLWLGRWTTDGALGWVRTAGTTVQTTISAVGAAPNDDVFVGGTTYASTTDPLVLGAGEANQTTFTRIGTFFARYHADGSLAWAKVEQGGDEPLRIMPTSDGGFFAMGVVGSSYATFGGVMLIYRSVPVSTPTFLARFDGNGNMAWVRTMGCYYPDAALMADGGVVVAGAIGSTSAVFQGGAVADVTVAPDGGDLALASYSPAGDLRWLKQVKGLPGVSPQATTVLPSGDILVDGTCNPYNDGSAQVGDAAHTQAVFGPGEANETKLTCVNFDLVLARYTPAGALVWAKIIPPALPQYRGLAPLPDGGFVMASGFYDGDTIDFDPGMPGSVKVSKVAQYGNLVISWHNGDGTARAARVIATGSPRVLGLSVLSDTSLVIAGAFSGTTVFGPQDAARVSYTKTGGGYDTLAGEDMFLARLRP